MPQMAPLNWLNLFILFVMLFLFSLILNYYLFFYSPQSKTYLSKTKIVNWKW